MNLISDTPTSGPPPAVRVAAAGFAVSCFVSMVLTDVPDLADSEARTTAFYDVAAHRTQAVVAFYVLAVAMACFGVLVTGLCRRLRDAGAGLAADVAAAAGAVYVALSLAAAAAFASPAAGVVLHLGGGSAVDPQYARSASALGDALMLLAAPLAAGAAVAAICLGARRVGMLPRWLTAAGLVVAVALVAGVTWFPLLALLAWVLALSAAGGPPRTTDRPAQLAGSGTR